MPPPRQLQLLALLALIADLVTAKEPVRFLMPARRATLPAPLALPLSCAP